MDKLKKQINEGMDSSFGSFYFQEAFYLFVLRPGFLSDEEGGGFFFPPFVYFPPNTQKPGLEKKKFPTKSWRSGGKPLVFLKT